MESFTGVDMRDWALVLLKEKEKRRKNGDTIISILTLKKKFKLVKLVAEEKGYC